MQRNNTEVDGTWKWSNGQTIGGFSHTNYGGSTPQNTVNTPDCFQIFTDDVNGTWQIATSCNVNNSFICQIGQGQSPKVPTPPPGAATTRPQPGTTSAPVTWSTDCGPMWVKDSVTNYCYKFNDNTLTWDQAQADCKSQGAQLTSISNYHEERFISDHLFGYTSPALWIGMNSLNVHQGYHWIDGAGFGYINWAPGEPNNVGNNERCGEIIASGSNNGMWNDVPCDQRRSYVCKRKSKDFPTMPAPTTPSVPAGKIFGCPSSDWYSYKSNCYLVKQTAMSWSDARTFCQQKGTGSELASIADENEQNFVFSQLPRVTGYRDQFWIGLNDMDVQMRFKWTDNSTVTYTRWAENEPNNYQNRPEDCVTLIQKDGMWNDEMCENPKQGFVCKVPKSIEPNNVPQMVTNTGCPQSGYVAYKYHCYKVMSSSMLPWSEALSSCTGSGGTLAVITDKYQQAFLASQIAGTSGYYWIGLTNSGSPYQWVDKSNLAYTAWSSNHTGNEVNTCVAMKSQGPGVGLWVNIQCPGRLRYICQTSRSGFSTPLIITTTTTAPPTCPSDWQDYNGYCYKAYNDDANLKTYFDARESCRSMGADLLSLHSSAEESFAFSYSVKGYSWTHYTYWIGLNDFDVEKGYKWVDGTGVNYTNWGNGEPNDSGGTDDCVEYNTIQRNWNDNSCYLSKPFICKLKKGQQLSVTKPTLPPTDAPQCGSLPDWKYFNGSCYFINSQKYGPGSRLTWFDARQYCMSQGGDLASVHSVQEAGFISVLISRTVQSDIWIGLNDLGVDQFGWTDGTPFDFMHWNGGEPNDAFGSEKCGQVIQSTGYWNDNDCNEKYHFMCKRPQGTLSTVIPTSIKPPVGGCPNGYTRVSGGGRCYKLFASRDKNQRLNYTQARDACRTFGASYDLAGINTRIEVDTLVNMVDGQILDNSDVWIGLSDLNSNRRFTWQDSSPLNSKGFATNWDKSQPQTYGGQCVVMETDQRHAGKWKNIACSNNRPYICETRQDPSISIPSQSSMCKKTDFVERNMDCYKLIPTPMSWNDAEQYCTQLQTHLVSILTVYEHAFVDTLAASMNSPVWIGMSDQQATGTYSWTDKNRIIYTKWGKNEPTYTQYGDGRCVSSYNGYWNDTQCSNTYPFVCKDPFFTPQITNTTYPGYCKVKTWKQNANFCYFVNLNGGLTYSAAEQDCTQRGMHLTSVDSRIEEIFLLNLIDADPNDSVDVWIGFRKKGGYFSWSDGTSPRYMNWARSPQNNDCVMMHHADGKWEDDSCSHTKGYICKTNKLPATSPPPTTSTTTTTTTTSTTTTSTTTTATTTGSQQPPSSSSSPSSKVVTPSMKTPVGTQSPHSVPAGRNTGRSNGVTIPRPGYQQQQQGSSSDLSGGQVSGIVIGVLALLVLICAGLLLYRKRNGGMNIPFKTFSNGSMANGLVNASYDTGYDKVSINGTNGSVKYVNGNHGNHANSDSVGFADA
ncbi:chromatin-modulating protein mrc1 [Mactra antiquata]